MPKVESLQLQKSIVVAVVRGVGPQLGKLHWGTGRSRLGWGLGRERKVLPKEAIMMGMLEAARTTKI